MSTKKKTPYGYEKITNNGGFFRKIGHWNKSLWMFYRQNVTENMASNNQT